MSDLHDTDPRVARLETHFEYIRRDLDEIKAGLHSVAATMATKAELSALKEDVKGGQRETRTTVWIVCGIVAAIVIGVAAPLEWGGL